MRFIRPHRGLPFEDGFRVRPNILELTENVVINLHPYRIPNGSHIHSRMSVGHFSNTGCSRTTPLDFLFLQRLDSRWMQVHQILTELKMITFYQTRRSSTQQRCQIPKLAHRFHIIPLKILEIVFVDTDNINLKLIWKGKRIRIAKTIF